jgi:hypothetical protein
MAKMPSASSSPGRGRIIIDYRRRIYWNRSIVEENMARGDRHGNREAKKPKKLKPKEIAPISTLASIQKKALEGRYRSTTAESGGLPEGAVGWLQHCFGSRP